MRNQRVQHLDRATGHLRDAIVVVQDMVYCMFGVIGTLLAIVNSFQLTAHPREAAGMVTFGTILMAIAGIRFLRHR